MAMSDRNIRPVQVFNLMRGNPLGQPERCARGWPGLAGCLSKLDATLRLTPSIIDYGISLFFYVLQRHHLPVRSGFSLPKALILQALQALAWSRPDR